MNLIQCVFKYKNRLKDIIIKTWEVLRGKKAIFL